MPFEYKVSCEASPIKWIKVSDPEVSSGRPVLNMEMESLDSAKQLETYLSNRVSESQESSLRYVLKVEIDNKSVKISGPSIFLVPPLLKTSSKDAPYLLEVDVKQLSDKMYAVIKSDRVIDNSRNEGQQVPTSHLSKLYHCVKATLFRNKQNNAKSNDLSQRTDAHLPHIPSSLSTTRGR